MARSVAWNAKRPESPRVNAMLISTACRTGESRVKNGSARVTPSVAAVRSLAKSVSASRGEMPAQRLRP
jgi:hypothetical protein